MVFITIGHMLKILQRLAGCSGLQYYSPLVWKARQITVANINLHDTACLCFNIRQNTQSRLT